MYRGAEPPLGRALNFTVDQRALHFPVLGDVGSKVVTEYGLAMTQPQSPFGQQLELADDNGDDSYQLPAAAVSDRSREPGLVCLGLDYCRWPVGHGEVPALVTEPP
jgi:hypothetical protein